MEWERPDKYLSASPLRQSNWSYLDDLDLSSNRITVVSVADAELFEGFPKDTRNFRALRRLDLSNNPPGAKAFEILCRVYAREKRKIISDDGRYAPAVHCIPYIVPFTTGMTRIDALHFSYVVENQMLPERLMHSPPKGRLVPRIAAPNVRRSIGMLWPSVSTKRCPWASWSQGARPRRKEPQSAAAEPCY